MTKKDLLLSKIISALSRNRQRASYGAVGRIIGLPAQSVMSGRSKTAENSWIVSARTKKPTGYLSHQVDANLEINPIVITNGEDLVEWLRAHAPDYSVA